MKTTIAFIPPVSAMLINFGYDETKLVNACQSEANKAVGKDGATKRSPFKGGASYKADGTLTIKELAFSEQVRTDYTIPTNIGENGGVNLPGEFVKWNDSLKTHFGKTGEPFGPITPDLLPRSLRAWLDRRFKLETAPKTPAVETPAVKRNGGVKSHKANVPA